MKLYYVSVLMLVTGCGDGSSTTSNPDSNVSRYSSDYAASDLHVFFTLSATSTSNAEVYGYVQDTSFNYVIINGNNGVKFLLLMYL